MKEKIGFKDLSGWVKAAIIVAWFELAVYSTQLIGGFIYAFMP